MFSIRTKFIRGEEVKFISHLDLMRAFERAIRRSRLPISYSQGFNPHQNIVFGLPLSVGVTSEAEYGDFTFDEQMDIKDFIERLNLQLPKGLEIVEAAERIKKDNIMAIIAAAAYDILLFLETPVKVDEIINNVDRLKNLKEVNVVKKTKKGSRDINIKPMIMSLDVGFIDTNTLKKKDNIQDKGSESCPWVKNYVKMLVDTGEYDFHYKEGSLFCVSALLSAGSKSNLKPELLVDALEEVFGLPIRTIKIHRTKLLADLNDRLCDPLDERMLSDI